MDGIRLSRYDSSMITNRPRLTKTGCMGGIVFAWDFDNPYRQGIDTIGFQDVGGSGVVFGKACSTEQHHDQSTNDCLG